jgi:ribosomal protein S1
MLEIGSVVEGQVVRVEPYGIYLKHGDETVIVLAPEVSWHEKGDLRERVRVGQTFRVHVLRYNYQTREIVGSVRRLQPEQNPYRDLSRLAPRSVLRGKVVFAAGSDFTVELPNGAWGLLPKHLVQKELKVGDPVEVEVADLEVDEARLGLQPACFIERTPLGPLPPCAPTGDGERRLQRE